MNIYQKLLKIQQELKAPKNMYNSFGNFSYRNCEGILDALKPLLAETKTVILLTDNVSCINNRYYVTATATLVDTESAEPQSVSITASAREEETKKGMDGSQITGASSSYARKYALNGLFAIDDVRDSDTTNHYGKDTPKTQSKTAVKLTPAPTTVDIEKHEFVMPSGAHKGKTVKEVAQTDKEYLEKLLQEKEVSDALKNLIRAELNG